MTSSLISRLWWLENSIFVKTKENTGFVAKNLNFTGFEAQKFIFCGRPQLAIFVMRSFWISLLLKNFKILQNSRKSRLIILMSFLISAHVVVKFETIITVNLFFCSHGLETFYNSFLGSKLCFRQKKVILIRKRLFWSKNDHFDQKTAIFVENGHFRFWLG